MDKYVKQLGQFCAIVSSFEMSQIALRSQLCHSLQTKPQDFVFKNTAKKGTQFVKQMCRLKEARNTAGLVLETEKHSCQALSVVWV